MATYSSILAWRIPWTEERGGLGTVHGVSEGQTQLSHQHLHFHFSIFTLTCHFSSQTEQKFTLQSCLRGKTGNFQFS